MWTGDKVIPEIITKESIQELGEVLRRKPVIWDNIHANDYDQRRVFLGAYCGRPIELYPYLNGILTNPNCEFEANFVAIHTLGTWYRIASSTFGQDESFDVHMEDLSDDDSANVSHDDCEMPGDLLPPLTAADVSAVISPGYCPKEALKLAICDWIEEFNMKKKAPLKSYSKRNLKTTIINGQTVLTAVPFDLDTVDVSEGTISTVMDTMMEDKLKCPNLTDDDILLLVDLFCLPYEHGYQGEQILKEFSWLIENVSDIYEHPPSKEKVSRWFGKLLRCDEHCQDIFKLFENFCKIPNEAILYDLYPYLWDLKEVVLALDTYVHWLSDAMTTHLSVDTLSVAQPLLSSLPLLPTLSEFTEPWHVKYLGGLTIALHKLLPFNGGYMFLDQAPDIPSSNVVRSRTYSLSDKDSLYKFCADHKSDVANTNRTPIDKEVESYLALSPETLFLVEDLQGVCGFIATVPDNKRYLEELNSKSLSSFSAIDGYKLSTSSHFVLKLHERVHNECVVRRILSSALSVLKASGATTIFHELTDLQDFDMYRKLGFFPADEHNQRLLWRQL